MLDFNKYRLSEEKAMSNEFVVPRDGRSNCSMLRTATLPSTVSCRLPMPEIDERC